MMDEKIVNLRRPSVAGGFRRDAILVVATALLAFGAVMVASASASIDRSLFDTGWVRTPFGRQLIFACVGLIVLWLTSRLAGPFLRSPTARTWVPRVAFALALASLVATLIPGLANVQHGSGRWVSFALAGLTLGFQPSELAKPALVLLLASLLCDRDADPRSLRRCFLPAAGALGLCVMLVGKADFGTSVLLAAVGGSMLAVAGCRVRHLSVVVGIGVIGLTGLLYAAPYRLARLTAFTDVWRDPQGAGYQPIQSLASIASGGWFGVGLGSGVQKYGYLPECRTDFIFAVICEEMGALGGGLVIGLFALMVWLGLRAMLGAPTRFERLVAFGLTATIGLQAVMNIAVVTVVAPTTGIPLPLISAGGSGTLTFCLAVGVLAAIAGRELCTEDTAGSEATLRGSMPCSDE